MHRDSHSENAWHSWIHVHLITSNNKVEENADDEKEEEDIKSTLSSFLRAVSFSEWLPALAQDAASLWKVFTMGSFYSIPLTHPHTSQMDVPSLQEEFIY